MNRGTIETTTRRAVLAGTAALPALALPALAETPDPAIAAVRAWVDAHHAWMNYRTPTGDGWEDDAVAMAFTAETDARLAAIGDAQPTTATGLALGLAALLYDNDGIARGAAFCDANSWFSREPKSTYDKALLGLWRSPAASEAFAKLGHVSPISAALPAAVAAPAAVEEDPHVAWLAEWEACRAEWSELAKTHNEWDTPRMVELSDRESELEELIIDTPASTPAGLVAIARMALEFNGHGFREDTEEFADLEQYLDQRSLRNIVASAERIAAAERLA